MKPFMKFDSALKVWHRIYGKSCNGRGETNVNDKAKGDGSSVTAFLQLFWWGIYIIIVIRTFISNKKEFKKPVKISN